MAAVFYFPLIGTPTAEGYLLSFLFRWCRQCFQCRPSTLQSTFNGSRFESEFAFPFGGAQHDVIQSQHAVRITILGLLRTSGPLTIRRVISAIVINPFQRIALRAWSHVGQKLSEVVTPQRRHRNATSAIARIFSNFRVIAASFGSGPCTIFSRMALPMRAFCSRGFIAQTPTTQRQASAKGISLHNRCFPAGTSTQPKRARISLWCAYFLKDRQASYCPANHIDQVRLHYDILHGKTLILQPCGVA